MRLNNSHPIPGTLGAIATERGTKIRITLDPDLIPKRTYVKKEWGLTNCEYLDLANALVAGLDIGVPVTRKIVEEVMEGVACMARNGADHQSLWYAQIHQELELLSYRV